jgi:hypothetical protein
MGRAGKFTWRPVWDALSRRAAAVPRRYVRPAGGGRFRVGDHVYAFQFHLETTDDTARAWALYPEAAATRGGEPASDAIERDSMRTMVARRNLPGS